MGGKRSREKEGGKLCCQLKDICTGHKTRNVGHFEILLQVIDS